MGDIQGCNDALERLLAEIGFSPSRDTVYLLGDLVNRGPDSVGVLRRCIALDGALLPLLGNAIPLPLTVANTTVSQPMIALLLIGAPLLPLVLMLFFKRDRLASRSRGAAWACGYEHEQSMVITAHGFAISVKENFAAVLKLRHWLNPVGWVPGWQSAAAPALFRRLAVIELAVLVVIVISRGA